MFHMNPQPFMDNNDFVVTRLIKGTTSWLVHTVKQSAVSRCYFAVVCCGDRFETLRQKPKILDF